MKIPMSQLPGISPLIADYFDDYEKVADYFSANYRSIESIIAQSAKAKNRELPLAQLLPILKEQNKNYGCGKATLEKIDWLSDRQACTVVTGQQTGLFGGPLFTIYKALTAIKLAERLGRNCSNCYVPVFWLASDDHDFREVNHINFLNKSNQPSKILYESHSVEAKTPVSKINLTDEISRLLEQLDAETHPSEFKQEVLDKLGEAYSSGTLFTDAFAKWLMTLLKPFGLIIIDASDKRIKQLGAPLFEKEISQHSPSSKAALQMSAKLTDANYHNQVQVQEGFLNLFYTENARSAIQIENGKFTVKGETQQFNEQEILQVLKTNPDYFSPNVMLRPLYQDALLPTVAYIAGPGETAYYAQMKGIYEVLDLPMPVIFPRKSLTLLEGKIEKALDKYELQVSDIWGNADQLINEIAKSQLPDTLEKHTKNTTLGLKENMEVLEKIVTELDPSLTDFVKNTQGRIQNQLEGLEKKILQAFKKKNEVIQQQIYKAHNSLLPNNHLQERELNIVPYLFKHGFGFIDQLYEAVDISNFEHQIVRV